MSLVYHAVRHFLYPKSQEEEIGYCAYHHPRSAQSPPVTSRGLGLLPKRATDPTDAPSSVGSVASDYKPTTHVKVVLRLLPHPISCDRSISCSFLASLTPSPPSLCQM